MKETKRHEEKEENRKHTTGTDKERGEEREKTDREKSEKEERHTQRV